MKSIIKNKALRDWVVALTAALILALVFRTWLYAPYRVPTGSMIHTIEIGDHLFVDKHAYGFVIPFTDIKLFRSSVKRGDIVVFPYPENPSVDFIKRVIATGGDTIEVRGEKVFVNNTLEKNDHIYYDKSLLTLPENIRITVPEGKLWVMGDNRRNSKDSRYWGFVNEKTVEGKGVIIYWSHNPNMNLLTGYRLNRIGRLLK